MDVKWKCCFKQSEDRAILEDFLPKQQHYRYVVNKFVILEKAELLYETKFESDILRKQMVINDQTDNVYNALPSSRDKARRQEHNLQKDISLNNSSAKKIEFICISTGSFILKVRK